MNVFCPNCGSPNEAGVKFCWKCGTSLTGLPASDAGSAEPAAPAAAEPTPPPPAAAEPVAPPPAAAEPVVPPPPAPAAPLTTTPPAPEAPVVPPPAAPAAPIVPPPAAAQPVSAPPPAAAPPAAAVALIVPPPPVFQAAPPPPPAYAAPLATPAPGGGGPRSRIPMPVMIGGVIAAIVVAAGVGMVFASGGGPDPTAPVFPTPRPTSVVVVTPAPTSGPAVTQGPLVSLAPPPTTVAPTAGPDPTAGPVTGGKAIFTDTLEVTVPNTWKVENQTDVLISMFTAAGGQFYLESGYVDPAVTAQALIDAHIAAREAKYPDVEICRAQADSELPNGPVSRSVILCYTAQTQSGKTFPARVFLEIGVSDGGTVLYFMKLYSHADLWEASVADILPVVDSIRWKLYTGG